MPVLGETVATNSFQTSIHAVTASREHLAIAPRITIWIASARTPAAIQISGNSVAIFRRRAQLHVGMPAPSKQTPQSYAAPTSRQVTANGSKSPGSTQRIQQSVREPRLASAFSRESPPPSGIVDESSYQPPESGGRNQSKCGSNIGAEVVQPRRQPRYPAQLASRATLESEWSAGSASAQVLHKTARNTCQSASEPIYSEA